MVISHMKIVLRFNFKTRQMIITKMRGKDYL